MKPLKLEIVHRFPDPLRLEESERVIRLLQTILQRQEIIMARSAEMQAFISRLFTVTNTLAERVQALKDQIGKGGMSAEEETAAVAEADAIVTSLENLGKDPENPVPEPEPTP